MMFVVLKCKIRRKDKKINREEHVVISHREEELPVDNLAAAVDRDC